MGEFSRLWYVGVIVVFFGSFGGALGDTMVRRSYVDAGAVVKARKMLENPIFVIGMCLTIILDPLLTFIGLLFAPSSIVTPFAGVHIFWAVLIAHFWLKEPMGLWQALGAVGVVVGVILIVCFSSKQADIENISVFDSYARTPEAIAYISVSAVLLLLILLAAFSLYPCSLGDWEYSVRRLGTALASGLLGGNTNVAAKFFSIIAVDLFAGRSSVFSNWRTYVVIICTGMLVISQLIFLNLALKRYEAVYVVPTVNSCLVASGTIGSILVLHEIPGNWPAFCIGLLCCLIGIIVLTVVHRAEAQPHVLNKEIVSQQEGVTGEEDLREYDNIAESSLRRHSSTLTRSLSVSAAAVADMAVILNSQAVYSMYTMQEKQKRASSMSLRMSDVSSPVSLSSRGLRCRSLRESPQLQQIRHSAEQRASWADTLSQWLSMPGSRRKTGTTSTNAEGEGGGRSTVSEPPLAIGRTAACPPLFDQAAVVAAVAHRRFSEAAAEISLERLHEDDDEEEEEKGKQTKQSQPLPPDDREMEGKNTRKGEGNSEDTQEVLQKQPQWRKQQQLQQQQRAEHVVETPVVAFSHQGSRGAPADRFSPNSVPQSSLSVRLSPLLVQVSAPSSVVALDSPPPASEPTFSTALSKNAPHSDTLAAPPASDTSPAAAAAYDTIPPAAAASDTLNAAAASVNAVFPDSEKSLAPALFKTSPQRVLQQQTYEQKTSNHASRTDSS